MSYANINTITLIHSTRNFTRAEVERGRVDLVECLCDPDEVKRWGIADEALARAELSKHKSTFAYKNGTVWTDVWALEFFETDEDGEFVNGGDLDYATHEFDGDSYYTAALDGQTLALVETEDD